MQILRQCHTHCFSRRKRICANRQFHIRRLDFVTIGTSARPGNEYWTCVNTIFRHKSARSLEPFSSKIESQHERGMVETGYRFVNPSSYPQLHSTDSQKQVDGWNLNEIIYDTVPTNGSYIAAASSYSKAVGTTGYPIWVERLSISNRGIQTGAKSGALNKWIQQGANPSVMANSTANPRIYGGVAVTAIGSAFGVVSEQGQVDKIRNWQVEDDTMNWKLVGDLDLGGSWKTSAFEPLLPF